MSFPHWETTDEYKVPQVLRWLCDLSHEHLVDLHLMLQDEMRSRGFPVPSEDMIRRVSQLIGESETDAVQSFCRKS